MTLGRTINRNPLVRMFQHRQMIPLLRQTGWWRTLSPMQGQSLENNSRFLHDVTAAMLEPLNKETAAMLEPRPNPSSGNLTLLLFVCFRCILAG